MTILQKNSDLVTQRRLNDDNLCSHNFSFCTFCITEWNYATSRLFQVFTQPPAPQKSCVILCAKEVYVKNTTKHGQALRSGAWHSKAHGSVHVCTCQSNFIEFYNQNLCQPHNPNTLEHRTWQIPHQEGRKNPKKTQSLSNFSDAAKTTWDNMVFTWCLSTRKLSTKKGFQALD